jgi:hypothetical protein
LTDLDRNWSSELWIAYHDEDDQNVRLAQRLWEDNGLDVPDDFLDVLLPYLGTWFSEYSSISGLDISTQRLEHENAYVRTSTAAAIAEAVEQVPQTAKQAIGNLQAFYREKAKILAPEFDQYVSGRCWNAPRVLMLSRRAWSLPRVLTGLILGLLDLQLQPRSKSSHPYFPRTNSNPSFRSLLRRKLSEIALLKCAAACSTPESPSSTCMVTSGLLH